MIIEETITKTKLKRVRVNFRKVYDDLPRSQQPTFRQTVMASQGWLSKTAFYDAINGRELIRPEAAAEIKSIFKQFGVKFKK